ncbi:MAG TPA: GH92 family glycosyl hydrolase [Parapedobacter sp.]|uniref:GH92 family glycosyl hydrolase n=1 Tax=Parapedobacter sp. TaxID=1958893 RepID=UPI002CBEF757|nr:GH92 family glycosyl hydrolase [Parapedobacter sp.]HWK59520.1 GH92 family glycosyl hydrolase [Parapedobacter sp.]
MTQLFMVGKKVYHYLGFVLLFLLGACSGDTQERGLAATDFVNPFIGASTSVGAAGVYHGLGKTFPGATTPYGMVQVSPNTITGGDNGPGYSYEHKTIEGFAFTQMSGVGWYGDLGNFLVMPTTGKLKTIAGKEDGSVRGYRSLYDKNSEEAKPGYYAVELTDYGIGVETTAAPHSGMIRFVFPESNESRIQIDLARRVGGTSVRQYIRKVDDHTIQGWMECTPEGGGWGDGEGNADYTVYFYARFSKPLDDCGFWQADIPDGWSRKRDDVVSERYLLHVEKAEIIKGQPELEGEHLGFFTDFETTENEAVTLQVGISFVDMAGAENNFNAELAGKSFDQVRAEATELWNQSLSRMNVQGGTDDQKTIFYTALYRTMIDPRTYTDVDGRYVGGDKKIYQDSSYMRRTIFSGWDVFRSQFPLQTIINPRLVSDQLNSLISLAEESGRGYFERWELLNAYSGCMIGNPAVNVLAEAYVKGIRDYDVEKAYQYAVNSVEKFGNSRQGYTPGNLAISETFEYAYSEWCVAQLAHALGKEADVSRYTERSKAYRQLFDEEKGWFRPKDEYGEWLPWPAGGRETEGYGCIESNPYQQGWFVPHDLEGLQALLGGRDRMLQDLIQFFEQTPADFNWNAFYNHANEPVHHVPFLFNRLGKPSLTQRWTRQICENAYHNAVEKGLVGNEDVGQMSAWYVLAASGLHPVAGADGRYEITSPIFDKISFRLDEAYATGKEFTVVARNNSPAHPYIQSIKLNGNSYHKSYLTHATIVQGGELVLEMGDKPVDNLETN